LCKTIDLKRSRIIKAARQLRLFSCPQYHSTIFHYLTAALPNKTPMKKLLTLALLVTFFSCDKADPEPETGIPATNTNPNTPGEKEELPWWYIPNWRHGDTLESVITQNGQITGLDTIYTYVEGNATMIVYQGKKYYIWKQAKYKEEKLIPDQNGYTNCI